MDKNLSKREYVFLASLLFGMFFGAGNLIFPGLMGQMAGEKTWSASLGFIITGVGLPLLGIIAISLSKSEGLFDLGCKVSRPFSMFFTCVLYLTIGPFFAIPRTATVSYTVGINQLFKGESALILGLFSVAFFAAVLWFSLRPSKILTWIGKILNPVFLVFLAILLLAAFFHPMGQVSAASPTGEYVNKSFFTGFLEGYNTMDALASLAFGIIIIEAVRDLGVKKPKNIAKVTAFSGIFCAIMMAIIYLSLAVAGAQARGIFEVCPDGGTLLSKIAGHYFGSFGAVFLAVTITVACLKTAVGLVTACSTTFGELFPNKLSYKKWAILFTLVSFGFANFGLNNIIGYSIPVLMFLYPLTIVIIIISIIGGLFDYDSIVYKWTIGVTMVPAVIDGIKSLPAGVIETLHLGGLIEVFSKVLPLSSVGMDWVVPAVIGFAIGMVIHLSKNKSSKTSEAA